LCETLRKRAEQIEAGTIRFEIELEAYDGRIREIRYDEGKVTIRMR